MNISWVLMGFYVSVIMVAATVLVPVPVPATTIATAFMEDDNFREFINRFEHLVLNTTEQALKVTAQVYQNLTRALPPLLRDAIVPITSEYLRTVEATLKCPRNYSEQRKLLRRFRYNNKQIERLRHQIQPEYPRFEFHLISNNFYNAGCNVTEFDNIYLRFMLEFHRLSQTLWDTTTEQVADQQQELLDLLHEIEKEKELSERDKLYDEFIEMFLFKTGADALENRQLQ